MKRSKLFSRIFAVLALVLSHAMCAVVAAAYSYQALGAKYEGWSAPPSVAFLWAVPFLIGIALCAGLAWFFSRKSK